ncbi:biotin--protein ligase [Picosynechococcus sp. PCC 7117]|nr:biotin--protein ligase [Picosynechococcus sp. PCC 7117]
MAIDAWLLDQHLQGKIPSVLRFYTWQPVAISLGYHQRKYPDFWNDLTYQGKKIDLVRRPSGGRAVLHQGDLTYAIITSGLKGSRQTNYETLCQFLIAGFGELGIPLSYGHQQRNYGHFDSCFRTHTKADLVTESGYKLIGSAQLRRQGAILQHGSIRLNPDPELYEKVFGETLQPISHSKWYSYSQIISILFQALQNCLDITFLEIASSFDLVEMYKIENY